MRDSLGETTPLALAGRRVKKQKERRWEKERTRERAKVLIELTLETEYP